MVNWIWLLMIAGGMATFVIKGEAGEIVGAMTASAERSVKLVIGLLGIMAIWTGFIKICEAAGITDFIGRVLRFPMRLLFPGLEKKSKSAQANITMNIASNMLGLSDAATPFGIKAMEDLNDINPHKGNATNYMVTFLIVNASCIQLLPSTIISLRAGFKSGNPGDIIIPSMIAAMVALIFGLGSAFILKRFYRSDRL